MTDPIPPDDTLAMCRTCGRIIGREIRRVPPARREAERRRLWAALERASRGWGKPEPMRLAMLRTYREALEGALA